jgi:hypothetical protein
LQKLGISSKWALWMRHQYLKLVIYYSCSTYNKSKTKWPCTVMKTGPHLSCYRYRVENQLLSVEIGTVIQLFGKVSAELRALLYGQSKDKLKVHRTIDLGHLNLYTQCFELQFCEMPPVIHAHTLVTRNGWDIHVTPLPPDHHNRVHHCKCFILHLIYLTQVFCPLQLTFWHMGQ